LPRFFVIIVTIKHYRKLLVLDLLGQNILGAFKYVDDNDVIGAGNVD